VSVENGKKDEGHSTPEIEDLGETSVGGRLSGSPVIHLGPDGAELYEDGEPVIREQEEYYLYRLDRLLERDEQNVH
jgi:hypothetical protein